MASAPSVASTDAGSSHLRRTRLTSAATSAGSAIRPQVREDTGMHFRQERLVRHHQGLRDELRHLLLEYFEYHQLLQEPTEDLVIDALQQNFESLRLRLKAFWVLHDHLGDFIPGLVEGGINERRQARRDATQYLLLLLPETPPDVSELRCVGSRGSRR